MCDCKTIYPGISSFVFCFAYSLLTFSFEWLKKFDISLKKKKIDINQSILQKKKTLTSN